VDTDTSAQSFHDAWNHLPIHTIQKVFNRIPIVLQRIVDGYLNVEDRRGCHGSVAPRPG